MNVSLKELMKSPDETWKGIADFPRYAISNRGRIKSYRGSSKEKLLRKSLEGGGYFRIYLCKDGKRYQRKIHRLVLEAFIGPRPIGCEANHKNGIKTDCDVENLEWITHSENMKHASRLGLL